MLERVGVVVLLVVGCGGQPPAAEQERAPVTVAAPEPPPMLAPDRERVPRPAVEGAPVRSLALAEAIAALPVIARIDDLAPTPFVLRGKLTPRRARAMAQMARHIVSDVATRFVGGPDAETLEAVDVCLFEDDDAYGAFADLTGDRDSMLGFYLGRERLVVANLGRSVGNLRHELVHPLVGDDFRRRGQRIPAWLNEGLGSLYGTSKASASGVSFLVNYRLRHVRDALRRDRLPTLETMASSGRAELYGDRRMTFYGTSRYLLLYLDARGTLETFYRELASGEPTAARQLELLEKHIDYRQFVRWTRRLRNGRRPVLPR